MQTSPPVVPARSVSPLIYANVYYLYNPVLGNWHVPGFKKYYIDAMSNSRELIFTWLLFIVTTMYEGCFGFTSVKMSPQAKAAGGNS